LQVAGWCRSCGRYVWLNEQWGCVDGHPWGEISGWYDPATGQAVIPYWLQPAAAPAPVAQVAPPVASAPVPEMPAPAPAPSPAPEAPVVAPAPQVAEAPAPQPAGTRIALLADVLAALGQYPGYSAQYGTDTDIVIGDQVADASWGIGNKKVEYSAVMKAVESERTVYFWEMLKEKGAGMNFGGFESESYTTVGKKRSGVKKETVIGPDGVAMDYEWDYAATRRIVEEVAARHGWQLKVVLRKKSAQW
jgi:hypothetical protein